MRLVSKAKIAEAGKSLEKELIANETASMRQAVRILLPQIKKAMEAGYTVDEIAKNIGKHVPIEPKTLRSYLYGKDSVDDAARKRAAKKKQRATPAVKSTRSPRKKSA